MLTCWCIADFTRYVFYCFGITRDLAGSIKGVAVAMKLMKIKSVEKADDPVFKIPFPLVWIRYSLFIVLYPTGVFGELMVAWMTKSCICSAIAVMPPNTVSGWLMHTLKFMFGAMGLLGNEQFYWGMIFLSYVFGLPPLYFTLLGARKKQLAPAPKADKACAAKKNQ